MSVSIPTVNIWWEWGAAIAPWFRLGLPSCGPGFESQAHHLCFFQFVLLKFYPENNENKQKEAGIGPFFNTNTKHCTYAVGWGKGRWGLVTPVKAIRVGVGLKNTKHLDSFKSRVLGIQRWPLGQRWAQQLTFEFNSTLDNLDYSNLFKEMMMQQHCSTNQYEKCPFTQNLAGFVLTTSKFQGPSLNHQTRGQFNKMTFKNRMFPNMLKFIIKIWQ